jgi:hypothetical protein
VADEKEKEKSVEMTDTEVEVLGILHIATSRHISNIGNTPTTKKGIIQHRKIKERKAHNNCLRKTSNNRRKIKASTAHSSITTTLMD